MELLQLHCYHPHHPHNEQTIIRYNDNTRLSSFHC